MQTSEQDLRAGYRLFREWRSRLWRSTRTSSDDPLHRIYLANYHEVQQLDYTDYLRDDAFEEKVRFIGAYISMVALDSRHFERDVRRLLKWQGRLTAPKHFGIWTNQRNIAEFGSGIVNAGAGGSIFCEEVKQIDFSNLSSVMPFDQVLIRRPAGKWKLSELRSIASQMKNDFSWDGVDSEISFYRYGEFFSSYGEFAGFEITSEDYGISPPDRSVKNAKQRLRRLRSNRRKKKD